MPTKAAAVPTKAAAVPTAGAVAPQDRGRVIGREGRTAAALRTLVSELARRRGSPCTLEILD